MSGSVVARSNGSTDVDAGALARLLETQELSSLYQPIVDLRSGQVVAHEALVRGPAGSALEGPAALFAAAHAGGLLTELEWACQRAALDGALAARLPRSEALFMNVEPRVLAEPPADLQQLLTRARAQLQVVVEFTERSLTSQPARLLQVVDAIRAQGWGIALDDVGADPHSLALMPLLRPDVVKLDLRLVQQRPNLAIAEIVTAVSAYAQQTGAVVLAEGIETGEHVDAALAMGATLGQGWHFGRPQRLRAPEHHLRRVRRDEHVSAGRIERGLAGRARGSARRLAERDSLFDLVAARCGKNRATKPLLLSMSVHLERQAMTLGPLAVVLAAFEKAPYFTPATAARYATLAQHAAFVGALGADMSTEPAPGVRGTGLAADDPIMYEWDVAVVGPHFAAALVARDLGDSGSEDQRRFDYVLTYDRELVVQVAAGMMGRMASAHLLRPVHRPAKAANGELAESPAVLDGAQLLHSDLGNDVLLRALAASRSGITISDAREPDCPLVYVNPAFERLAGRPAAELLAHNCRMLQGEGTDKQVVADIGDHLRAGRPTSATLLNYRADGTPW